MSWLSLLGTTLSLIRALVKFFNDRRLISAGRAQATLQSLEIQHERIRQAREARLDARRTNDADGLYDDDGHKRD